MPSTYKKVYNIREGDVGRDKEAIIRLWGRDVACGEDQYTKYSWFYEKNPLGVASVFLLYEKSESNVVGSKAIGPRLYWVEGKEASVGVLADFVVSSQHRTLGPGLKLMKQTVKKGQDRYKFLYGFPNHRAAPLYNYAGYNQFGMMVRYTRVVHTYQYIKRYLPASLSKPISFFFDFFIWVKDFNRLIRYRSLNRGRWEHVVDSKFDELWEKARRDNITRGIRNGEFLRWRFLENPKNHYQIFVLDSSDAKELYGYIVCYIDKHDIVHVVDFLVVDKGHKLNQLFSAFINVIRKRPYIAISVEFLGSEVIVKNLQKFGFKEREKRPAFEVGLNRDNKCGFRLDWYMTAADEDQ